jgi:hypothetical protein
MTLRRTHVLLAATALALAAVAWAASSAHAFTIETLGNGGDGSSRFADPNERVKNFGLGSQPFGSNGPTVQFGAGQSPTGRPFGPRPYVPQQNFGNGTNNND